MSVINNDLINDGSTAVVVLLLGVVCCSVAYTTSEADVPLLPWLSTTSASSLVARVLNNARMNTDTSATQTASFVLPADTSPGTYLGRWDWVPANGGKERGEGVLRFVRSSSFFF